jgi:hypothetical protein
MKKAVIGVLILSVLTAAVFYSVPFLIPAERLTDNNLPASVSTEKSEAVAAGKQALYLRDFSKIRENLVKAGSDFLEVNLSKMKVSFYRNGFLEKEVPISARGDPQGWGGSAAGLYSVLSKDKFAYSVVADVYMPYAIHYYGKYYIHGEPFYPGGEKRYSDATGGCIQLLDKDAKTIFNMVKEGTPVLVIDEENDGYQYAEPASQFPEVAAKSYLVADLDSGFVFAEKNSQGKLPIASLTKLMTAVVVSENVDLRKSVEIIPSMLEAYGSTEGLDVGKSFRVVELFYPLLTLSSNDAAQALSHFLSPNKTLKLMNEKAVAVSMENSEFVGPDGFASENVSTAQDIFYLIRYVLNNRPPLLKITKGEKVPAFGQVRFGNLFNKNIFIDDPDFIGGKTGFLNVSRYDGVFVFGLTDKNNKERRIAVIILGTSKTEQSYKEPDRLKSDTEAIVNWLKENYFQGSNDEKS